jgi:hypothetical protein
VDDPEEQIILSRIKSMIEARISYQKIATQFNAEQIPLRREHHGLCL